MPRYIDADKLNIAIEEWFDGVCVYDVSPSEAVNDFQSIVDEQPTISPDDVRGVGEWEHQEPAPTNWTFCSVCGRHRSKKYKWYYCPNCGARMKGAEDGTTD